MTDAGSIAASAARPADDHPGPDVLASNAGIVVIEDLLERGPSLTDAEAIGTLRTHPDASEVCVARVHPLCLAGREGQESYGRILKGLDDRMTAAATAHPR